MCKSAKMDNVKTQIKSINEKAVGCADLVSAGLVNSLSVLFGVRPERSLTISHFNSANKPVLVKALTCVLNSVPQINSTVNEVVQCVKDIGEMCLDVEKELCVYKDILYNHGKNFAEASTLISEIKPVITKIEKLNFDYVMASDVLNNSQDQQLQQLQQLQQAMEAKPEPPVFDYAQIVQLLPKPEPQPVQQPVNIRHEIKETSVELERRNKGETMSWYTASNLSTTKPLIVQFQPCSKVVVFLDLAHCLLILRVLNSSAEMRRNLLFVWLCPTDFKLRKYSVRQDV